MPNRLAAQDSPYLLQHAGNPVDWYAWGPEALAAAREEDKPIFLSIGYATCHWCHVMAHQCFEDEEVAAALNRDFICIKVDREDRPDLDAVYMKFCQALTGSGGWPLSVFLTPEGEPFYAGTYFPKSTGYGRPGMLELCREIARLWKQDRPRILDNARRLVGALRPRASSQRVVLGEKVLEKAYWSLAQSFDSKYGGFGGAPKFPTPHQLSFLLRWHARSGQERALEMVCQTLAAMRAGGIFDQLGLGFHRYSVDQRWLVPHFEKMLYDQALLALAYLEAHQATGRADFADTARDIFAYVLRDLASPQGGFYAAEDADSQGGEGLYYLWTRQEVLEILGPELGERFCRYYGVSQAGDMEDGRSVLRVTRPLEDFARQLGKEPAQVQNELARGRELMLQARHQRPRPSCDDKVITAWNGLMIAALARGARVLEDASYLEAAEGAARFLLSQVRDQEGRPLRRWRRGRVQGPGFLDDYAFLTWGLIELHQADSQGGHLERARELAGLALADFWDELHHGFYYTPHHGERLVLRDKDLFDGALPSGNSVWAGNLLRLARLSGEGAWRQRALELMEAMSAQVAAQPAACTQFLLAVDYHLDDPDA